MCYKIIFRYLFSAFLLLGLPTLAIADELLQSSISPCPTDVLRGRPTKYSSVSFIENHKLKNVSLVCYKGKALLETRLGSNGGLYYYEWVTDDYQNEFVEEGGKYVKKNGQPVISRMIVKEETGLDADPRYWMLDFRQEEPIVAGPMKARESSRYSRLYSVIWTDQSVIVFLDDDSGPRGGSGSHWTKDAYKYIDKVLLDDDSEDKLSLITKNNRELKEGETLTTFDAYVYDYKNKKIIETDIEKEKTEAKRKKR
jgi:hypothetical protein